MNKLFIFLIRLYQLVAAIPLRLVFGAGCKFTPSCSQYSIDCFKKMDTIKAVKMSFARIIKCHPFSKGGFDPVKY